MAHLPVPDNRYEIEEILSETHRTTVARARDEMREESVILKCLTSTHPRARDIIHFRREFEIGRHLRGDQFVDIYRLEHHDGRYVLIEEDFGAESLARTLERRRFDIDEFLQLAIDIAGALGELHHQEVIHRDINPSNIVWNPQTGRVKLIDFGLSAQFHQVRTGGPSSQTLGTLPYISPEQTGRTSRSVDYRTDYYSLGVTLYELLTGVRPFEGDQPGELIHAHLARRPMGVRQRRADVPHPVGRLISKLMAKPADERYQTAHGLIVDLKHCLEEYRAEGRIDDFELGRRDVRTSLRVSQQLVGREDELGRLEEMLRQADSDRGGLVSIRGPAGIGKSALAREIQQQVLEEGGRFVTGKFEESGSGHPFEGLTEAIGQWITQLLTLSSDELAEIRSRVRDELGEDEALVAEVVPELKLLVGNSARGPQLDVAEAIHRFQRAFVRLVRTLTGESTVQVVVLDDLQWAGPAAIELLEQLIDDRRLDHLLVVATYRDEEVGPDDPLSELIGSLQQRDRFLGEIRPGPLDESEVRRMVAASLDTGAGQVAILARTVHAKTSGNPYFVGQFLEELTRRNLLWFDGDAARWRWDDTEIAGMPVTENVVDVLQARIDGLPEATRQIVFAASFLGMDFRLEILATVLDRPGGEVYEELQPALEADIVAARSEFELLDPDDIESPAVIREMFFPHDQVRQAARNLGDIDEQRAIQLQIGRRLEASRDLQADRELLFLATRNYNQALEAIEESDEYCRVMRLNLEAGRQAFDIQAVAEAAEYLEQASSMFDDTTWEEEPELAREVLLLRARAAVLVGDFEAVDDHVDEAVGRLDDPVDRVGFVEVQIRSLTLQSRLREAIEVGRGGLQQLGVELPADGLDEAFDREFERIEARFDGRPVEAITEVSTDSRREVVGALKLLASLQVAAGLLDFDLLLVVGLEALELTFETGVRPESLVGLAIYGTALCMKGRPDRGYRAGRLAMEQARRFDHKMLTSHVAFVFGSMIMVWSRPLEESLPIFEEGLEAGLHSGNHLFAGFNQFLLLLHRFYLGRDLRELAGDVQRGLTLSGELQNTAAVDLHRGLQLLIEQLRGDAGETDEADRVGAADEFVERARNHGTASAVTVFRIGRAQISIIDGRSEIAVRQLESTAGQLGALVGTFDTGRHPFYYALALVDVMESMPVGVRRKQRRTLDRVRQRLAEFAESAPANFEARRLIVEAGVARLEGDLEEAMRRFDESIELARDRDLVHLEAMASERAGDFWLDVGKRDFAALYLRDSIDAYDLWGADDKRRQLEQRHGRLISGMGAEAASGPTSTSSGEIDVDSVFKASEIIASQLELEELLPVLMEVTLENAGATDGTFVVAGDDGLAVTVQGSADGQPERYDPPIALDDWEDGPRSVIRYVYRTREPLVVGRAYRDRRFRDDPYIDEYRTRSVFCVPATEHGRLRGILYLENNLTDDAFGPERIRVLKILAGHIGIALNKARLYDELREKKERFRQLAENVHEVFWLMEWPSRQIVYLSPAYEAVWGRPMPELPIEQTDWLDPVVEQFRDEVTAAFDEELPEGDFDQIYRIERPSGAQRWIHSRAFSIRDGDGEIQRIAGVARDVTRERELSRMKDEFISVISHELRTPLTPITGIFSMLERDYGDELPDEVRSMTKLGLRNSRRLLRLIDDLLDIQKLSMEQVVFEYEVLEIGELIEEALEINEPLGEASDVVYTLETDETPMYVCGDRDRLFQVMTNLLSNAVKFSEAGDAIEVRVRRVDESVRISVTDDGPGIPEEVRDRLFEKFTQADTTLTRQHGGIGLGLAITRALVERLDGDIYFETELGEGTTFHVELPLVEAPRRRGDRMR